MAPRYLAFLPSSWGLKTLAPAQNLACRRRSSSPLAQDSASSPATGTAAKRTRARRKYEAIPQPVQRNYARPFSDSPEVPEAALVKIASVPSAMARLRRHLRGRNILYHVAQLADCEFVRFTGIVFERCDISDRCPDGIPAEMEGFQQDVRFFIVNVPPGLVARSLAPPKTRSPAAFEAFAAYLHYTDPRLSAVYERYGLEEDDLAIEQDLACRRDEDFNDQLNVWLDFGDSKRTETDLMNPAGARLFEEPDMEYHY